MSKTSVALPVLQCTMFVDSENELFYDDLYEFDGPSVAWSLDYNVELSAPQFAAAAIPICQQKGIIISRDLF